MSFHCFWRRFSAAPGTLSRGTQCGSHFIFLSNFRVDLRLSAAAPIGRRAYWPPRLLAAAPIGRRPYRPPRLLAAAPIGRRAYRSPRRPAAAPISFRAYRSPRRPAAACVGRRLCSVTSADRVSANCRCVIGQFGGFLSIII